MGQDKICAIINEEYGLNILFTLYKNIKKKHDSLYLTRGHFSSYSFTKSIGTILVSLGVIRDSACTTCYPSRNITIWRYIPTNRLHTHNTRSYIEILFVCTNFIRTTHFYVLSMHNVIFHNMYLPQYSKQTQHTHNPLQSTYHQQQNLARPEKYPKNQELHPEMSSCLHSLRFRQGIISETTEQIHT